MYSISKFIKINSFAKVNLSLNVVSRLKNNYHRIESLITFINLKDEIYLRNSQKKNHKITFYGKFSNGIEKNNTIKKLLEILDKNNYLNKKKFEIRIKKNIPHSSGLGGGSMNAAFLMKFLLKKYWKKNLKKNFNKIAKKIGSDVLLGDGRGNKILLKNGKVLKSNSKILLNVVVCKPNFGCTTKSIYSGLKHFTKPQYFSNNENYFNIKKLVNYKNDLENVAFKKYSKLRVLKKYMDSLPNLLFSRMTGSGSIIIGYFNSSKSAKKANKLLKKQYKSYWSIVSKTI
tara:strand:+ start:3270 stop:4130 length:861 start_codon:yes stop_codon:yes gene_type:complete